MDEKAILLKVLNIIGYEDNKQEFVAKFFALIYAETIAQEATKLTTDQQAALNLELQASNNEESQKSIILKYLSVKDFEKRVADITEAQFQEYLETIYPTLSKEKQAELTQFLTSLPNPNIAVN